MAWTPFNGRRQIFVPPGIVVAKITGTPDEEEDPKVAIFKVRTPDSRLRVKISVFFSPDQGNPTAQPLPYDLSVMGAALYLEEVEDDFTGPSGGEAPCVAIEGTFLAPTLIPLILPVIGVTTPDLLGYSREFVTAGDAVRGFLTLHPPGGESLNPTGQWVVQTRYQPDGQRLPDDEWDEVKRACDLVNLAPIVIP